MDRMTLPDAAWRHRPGLAELAEALGAADGDARFVGGAVRDTLLGHDVADIDIATRHAPEAVIDRLTAKRIKAIPTGIAHGTITAVSQGTVIEVTTLRRDVATDGRHATVSFTDDWREDAARRDFTINALYADPLSGAVFDYFGGLDDLAARRVRFIGDPYQRIAEDHLRILRFFRFHARFGDTIDAAGLQACTDRANDLMALSRERIASEFLRLIVAPAAVATLQVMVDRAILLPVLPEVDRVGIDRLEALIGREEEAGVSADPIRHLAALIPPDRSEAVGARLKLSNANRKRLASAIEGSGSEGAEALAYRIGTTSAVDRLLVSGHDVAEIEDRTPPRLPISGGALVSRGLVKGPQVAAALRAVEDRWIAEQFPDAARTSEIADEIVAQALRSDSSA